MLVNLLRWKNSEFIHRVFNSSFNSIVRWHWTIMRIDILLTFFLAEIPNSYKTRLKISVCMCVCVCVCDCTVRKYVRKCFNRWSSSIGFLCIACKLKHVRYMQNAQNTLTQFLLSSSSAFFFFHSTQSKKSQMTNYQKKKKKICEEYIGIVM